MPAAPRMHEWPDPRRLHSCIRVAPFLDGRTTATDTQPPAPTPATVARWRKPLPGQVTDAHRHHPNKSLLRCLCAHIKLERLRSGAMLNHYALKPKLYLAALHSAFEQLQTMQPFRFVSL